MCSMACDVKLYAVYFRVKNVLKISELDAIKTNREQLKVII